MFATGFTVHAQCSFFFPMQCHSDTNGPGICTTAVSGVCVEPCGYFYYIYMYLKLYSV